MRFDCELVVAQEKWRYARKISYVKEFPPTEKPHVRVSVEKLSKASRRRG